MADIKGMTDLREFLQEFPERIQRRVIRLALKKAAVVVKYKARTLYPRGKRLDARRGWHTQDHFINKAWNKPDVSMQLIGTQSGFGRLNHLVEDGTTDRYQRSKTRLSPPMRIGTKLRSRKVKTATGGWRTVKELAYTTKRRGMGSRDTVTGSMTNVGRGRYTGRMTAQHPLMRAMRETSAEVQQVIANEIRAGLHRVLEKQASDQ